VSVCYNWISMKLGLVIYCVIILVLTASIVNSGLNYQYDIDELFHTQITYLLIKGYKPFVDFFSIHSPIFHTLLIPIYKVKGFSFDAIYVARITMVFLFILRSFLSFILVKKVLSTRTALIFLPLFLFDPFTVFAGMQIRPDNLMMLLFTLGLLFLTISLTKASKIASTIAGVTLATTLLVSLKIVPSVATVILLFSIYCFLKKKRRDLLQFTIGLVLPVLIFIIIFLTQGNLPQMIQQVFFDARKINEGLLYPSPPGNYHKPNNIYIYGVPGRPLTWTYAITLPVLWPYLAY